MTKPKFTLALEYFDKFKKATNEKDKQFYYSQYMNEVFRVDQLYAEDDKKNKKKDWNDLHYDWCRNEINGFLFRV